MIYKPFFDMNVLLADGVINQVMLLAFLLIVFHVLFAAYFIYKTISTFKKSSLHLRAKGI